MAFAMQCDSDNAFFVEHEEPTRPRMHSRENARLLARQRQEMIANELSRLASDEYMEDIMQHVRHMEVMITRGLHCRKGPPLLTRAGRDAS